MFPAFYSIALFVFFVLFARLINSPKIFSINFMYESRILQFNLISSKLDFFVLYKKNLLLKILTVKITQIVSIPEVKSLVLDRFSNVDFLESLV